MAEGKLLKAWRAGCAWQFVIMLIVMIVLLGGMACLGAVVAIVPVSEDMRILLGLGGFLLLLFAMLGGATAWGI